MSNDNAQVATYNGVKNDADATDGGLTVPNPNGPGGVFLPTGQPTLVSDEEAGWIKALGGDVYDVKVEQGNKELREQLRQRQEGSSLTTPVVAGAAAPAPEGDPDPDA